MTTSTRSRRCQDHSFTYSSMSIRLEWSRSFHSGINKFPVQIVSYSSSDWAGCRKSRKSTSGSLVSVFNVNLQSASRIQGSVAHSSAGSELYAMIQAAVESLAIKNFIQQFVIRGQRCHSDRLISKNQWLHDWVFHTAQSILSSGIYGFKMKSSKED